MIIDVNTYIGHWPFRQLRYNTAESLVRRMDKHHIDQAIVASIHGILYKNVHDSNEELAFRTKPHLERLIPFSTLNPTYPGWEEDLRRCAEVLELRGIRLYPQYHGYRLTDSASVELIEAVTQLGWTIQVPMRIVDRRQRHRWDLAEGLKPGDFEVVFNRFPSTSWIVLNGLGFDGKRLNSDANFLIEISRMTSVLQRNIPALIQTAGAQHLAFGSGMPFKVPEPALLKLECLDTSEAIKRRIAWRNVAEMLKLKASDGKKA